VPSLVKIINCIEITVWSVIICGIVIPPILLYFLAKLTFGNQRISMAPINTQLFIAILFENGSDLNLQRYLRGHKPVFGTLVYFLLTGWLLALLVLNNVYKGILTSDEVAPPEPHLKWKYIHELENFTIATPFKTDTEFQDLQPSSVSQTLLWYTLKYLTYMVEIYEKDFKYPNLLCFSRSKSEIGNITKCSLEKPTYKLLGFCLENGMGFYNIVSNCNSTAFVDLNSRIDDFLEFFNHQMKKSGGDKVFMKGTDDFLSPNQGWMMTGYHELYLGRLHRRLQSLIHSGILMIFEKWIDSSGLKKKLRKKSEKLGEIEVQPLSLSDIPGAGLQIQLLGCAAAGIVFFIETIFYFIL